MTDRELLDWLRQQVNASAVLTATAKSDQLDDQAPAASVQQVPGGRWATRYVDGSGTREVPFMVRYRVAPTDSHTRLDAPTSLYALADALEDLDAEASGITEVRGTDTPALVERGDDGSEEWAASFVAVHEVPSDTAVS